MKDLLLGLDIGTTGTKAALFTLEGALCGTARREYGLSHPCPGWAEQDPDLLWEACCAATVEVMGAVARYEKQAPSACADMDG